MLEQNRTRTRGLWVASGALAVALWGCGTEESGPQPLDGATATERTRARTNEIISGLAQTTGETKQPDGVTAALDTANNFGGCSNTSTPTQPDPATGGSASSGGSGASEWDQTTADLQQALTEIRDFAQNHVFRDELIESDDGTTVVYALDVPGVCENDMQCQQDLEAHPVRFSVTLDADDALHVDVLVGTDRELMVSFVLAADQLRARGDLATVKRIIEKVSANEPDPPQLPKTLSGVLELAVIKHGAADFSFRGAVLEPLLVEDDGGTDQPVRVALAASPNAAEVRLNSAEKTIQFSQDMGALDVDLDGSLICEPNDPGCGSPERTGDWHVHLDGMSGMLEVDGSKPKLLSFSGLGLGQATSFVDLTEDSIGTQRLGSLALNEAAERRFNMSLRDTDQGVEVSFEPSLEVKLAMALTHFSDVAKMDLPEWLMDEVFEVSFGGEPRTTILLPRSSSCNGSMMPDPASEQIKVLEGSVTLAASSLTADLMVGAGMCLVEAAMPPPMNDHPFAQVEATTCQ